MGIPSTPTKTLVSTRLTPSTPTTPSSPTTPSDSKSKLIVQRSTRIGNRVGWRYCTSRSSTSPTHPLPTSTTPLALPPTTTTTLPPAMTTTTLSHISKMPCRSPMCPPLHRLLHRRPQTRPCWILQVQVWALRVRLTVQVWEELGGCYPQGRLR